MTNRSADMHISGKMLHTIERFLAQKRQNRLLIPGIKHMKGHTQLLRGVRATSPKIIKTVHFVPLLLESRSGVGSDVPRSPCDQNSHTDVSACR